MNYNIHETGLRREDEELRMANYRYIAINLQGKQIKGSMEASSKENAIAALKLEGKLPLKVEEENIFNKDVSFGFNTTVKTKDIAVFCRQFYSIISAGIPIIRALDMLGEQTTNKKLAKAVVEVKMSIEKGDTLANAMNSRDDVFPSILISMVEAAEASGSLETCFSRMATYFEKSAKLKSVVGKAMIYPAFVSIVAIGVVVLLMMVVIPNFISMFEDMGTKLPPLTIGVLEVSHFFVHYWYILLFIVVLAVVLFRIFASTQQGSRMIASVALKVPLFGTLIIKSACGTFSRTMSSLISSGITLPNAMAITARGIKNVVIQRTLYDAKSEIERGIPMSVPLQKSGVFPPLLYNMTEIGEETGNLESMLVKAAEYYEEEVETATASLVAVMEPLLIIILALIVSVILGAIFQPMMSIYSSVENV